MHITKTYRKTALNYLECNWKGKFQIVGETHSGSKFDLFLKADAYNLNGNTCRDTE